MLSVERFIRHEDKEYKFVSSVYSNDCCLGYKIINDLKITRGAMILDGYDCYDSCIKYMDELIEKYNKYSKNQNNMDQEKYIRAVEIKNKIGSLQKNLKDLKGGYWDKF